MIPIARGMISLEFAGLLGAIGAVRRQVGLLLKSFDRRNGENVALALRSLDPISGETAGTMAGTWQNCLLRAQAPDHHVRRT